KLVANPGVTDLRGKVVGTSRIGATTDFALRRALSKLGLTPDRDVKILATGIGEADHADAAGPHGCHHRQPGEHSRCRDAEQSEAGNSRRSRRDENLQYRR